MQKILFIFSLSEAIAFSSIFDLPVVYPTNIGSVKRIGQNRGIKMINGTFCILFLKLRVNIGRFSIGVPCMKDQLV